MYADKERVMTFLMIVLAILVLLGLVSYIWYTKIISNRNRVNEALSDVDVQLKQRLDLIPNILTIAKKFMDHETELMTSLTQMRELANAPYDKTNNDEIAAHLKNANDMAALMGQLKITMENYPSLKSNETMTKAMDTYNEVEEQIAASRRFYNSSVTALNNSIQIFPGSVIANSISISLMPFYHAGDGEDKPINSQDYL